MKSICNEELKKGKWHAGEDMKALYSFLIPFPMNLFHLAIPGLYPSIINW